MIETSEESQPEEVIRGYLMELGLSEMGDALFPPLAPVTEIAGAEQGQAEEAKEQ